MTFCFALLNDIILIFTFFILMLLFINFIKSWLMFGFCQNVQIIHKHHHHFYPSIAPPTHTSTEALSRTMKPSLHHNDESLSANRSNHLHQTHKSKFYHSRRSYLNKNHRGIEVICKKGLSGGQNQRIQLQALKNTSNQQHNNIILTSKQQQPSINTFHIPLIVYRPIEQGNYQATYYNSGLKQIKEYRYDDQLQKSKNLSNSMQKMKMSTPSINIHLLSQGSSSRTKKKFINTHRLKQSTLGFQNESIFETKKINRQSPHKGEQKISLCIPLDSHKKKLSHRHAQTCRVINDDKDSILTNKQSYFLRVFKTEKLLQDAKSIVSHESDDNQCLNIEESMIISRSMDYFCHLTPEVQLPTCKLYLAKDNKINWVVCIRLFQNQYEQASFKQAQLYNKLTVMSEKQSTSFAVLELYKVLVEGASPHKSIFFVLEPYEIILGQYLATKKIQFRASHLMLSAFLHDLYEHLFHGLAQLSRIGFNLIQPIQVKDIVMAHGKYKFHSLTKFQCQPRIISPQHLSASIGLFLKGIQISIKWQ